MCSSRIFQPLYYHELVIKYKLFFLKVRFFSFIREKKERDCSYKYLTSQKTQSQLLKEKNNKARERERER